MGGNGPAPTPREADTNVETVTVQELVDMAGLALRLGEVNRVTLHADGWTPETDTTHTVMLAWLAPALANRLGLPMDTGDITEFAVVHDLLEVYTGDYNTLQWSPQQQHAKQADELRAMAELKHSYGRAWPWLIWRCEAYEAQQVPAARYVRAVDKILPKLTHFSNGYAQLLREGITPGTLAVRLADQYQQLEGWLYETWFAPVLKVYLDAATAVTDGYSHRWLDVQQIRAPKKVAVTPTLVSGEGGPNEAWLLSRAIEEKARRPRTPDEEVLMRQVAVEGRPVPEEIKRLLGEAE